MNLEAAGSKEIPKVGDPWDALKTLQGTVMGVLADESQSVILQRISKKERKLEHLKQDR